MEVRFLVAEVHGREGLVTSRHQAGTGFPTSPSRARLQPRKVPPALNSAKTRGQSLPHTSPGGTLQIQRTVPDMHQGLQSRSQFQAHQAKRQEKEDPNCSSLSCPCPAGAASWLTPMRIQMAREPCWDSPEAHLRSHSRVEGNLGGHSRRVSTVRACVFSCIKQGLEGGWPQWSVAFCGASKPRPA